jgi:hypothetical protein
MKFRQNVPASGRFTRFSGSFTPEHFCLSSGKAEEIFLVNPVDPV